MINLLLPHEPLAVRRLISRWCGSDSTFPDWPVQTGATRFFIALLSTNRSR
jgi:hypothetical protein